MDIKSRIEELEKALVKTGFTKTPNLKTSRVWIWYSKAYYNLKTYYKFKDIDEVSVSYYKDINWYKFGKKIEIVIFPELHVFTGYVYPEVKISGDFCTSYPDEGYLNKYEISILPTNIINKIVDYINSTDNPVSSFEEMLYIDMFNSIKSRDEFEKDLFFYEKEKYNFVGKIKENRDIDNIVNEYYSKINKQL